jgi:hypothetical protein
MATTTMSRWRRKIRTRTKKEKNREVRTTS